MTVAVECDSSPPVDCLRWLAGLASLMLSEDAWDSAV